MELAAPHPDMAVLQPQPGPHEGAVHAGTTVAGTGPLTPPSLIWVPHFLFLTRLSKPSVSSCKRPAHAVHASCPRWICGLGPMEGMVLLFGWVPGGPGPDIPPESPLPEETSPNGGSPVSGPPDPGPACQKR